MTMLLPQGVHPLDESVPTDPFGGLTRAPDEPPDEGSWFTRWVGRRRFNTSASEATPTFERSASHMKTGLVVISTNESGTARVAGRQPGRRSITLWIPTSVVVGGTIVAPTAGVLFSDTTGELQVFAGSFLGLGDSVTLPTESPVFVGLVPGQSVGYVQYMTLINPNG